MATNYVPPRHYLREGVLATVDLLHGRGVELPFELKRRDVREPGRKKKEEFEDKLYALIWRQFRKQRDMVRERFEAFYPGRKGLSDIGLSDIDFDDPEFAAGLMRFLTDAARHGIELFGESSLIGLDYTLINSEAVSWAQKYTFDLVKNINQTTVESLQKVITSFIETPGMTIGQVASMLPFNESRALMIASTEITRAYAQANALAGQQLQKEFQNVKVVKTWWTNADALTCPICFPLDGIEVGLNEDFPGGYDNPPAHPRCRCWTTTTTALAE